MKLVKGLLLGSAAGLAAVVGAQAADLPVRKAAPVEYVRVCSAHGMGFFYIPGTETCLRISGFARFEYNVASARQYTQSPTGFRSIGRLNLDARTQTAYGTLRSFIRFEMARRTGHFHSGTNNRLGNAELATGFDFFGQAHHLVTLDKAFIQFAGFTAGRATSFFDFYPNDLSFFGIATSDRTTNLLAYTASFGSRWSATISLEDPLERRYFPVVTNLGGAALLSGPTLFSGATAPIQIFDPLTGLPINSAFVGQQQTNRMPDIVANVRVDQTWGSAQLSALVHQVSTHRGDHPGGQSAFAGFTFTGFRPDTEYGAAVQAGVKVNLPMIAPGDLLYLQAAYARGCLDCTIGGAYVLNGATASQGGFPGTNGRFAFTAAEAVINPLKNELELTRSWSISAGFLHYWLPQLRSGFTAAYSKLDFPNMASFFVGGFANPVFGPTGALTTTGVVRDWNMINLTANLIWSPVRDLDIGVEVSYDRFGLSGAPVSDLNKCGDMEVIPAGILGPAAVSCPFTTKAEDEWRGRLRVQRQF